MPRSPKAEKNYNKIAKTAKNGKDSKIYQAFFFKFSIPKQAICINPNTKYTNLGILPVKPQSLKVNGKPNIKLEKNTALFTEIFGSTIKT